MSAVPSFHIRYPESLSSSVDRKLYLDATHKHVQELFSIDLRRRGPYRLTDASQFDVSRYWGIEQYILEEGWPEAKPAMEPQPAWEFADTYVEAFNNWAMAEYHALGVVKSDERRKLRWKRNVRFMTVAIQNDAIYRFLYDAPTTPWSPIKDILAAGLLISIEQTRNDGDPTIFACGATGREGSAPIGNRYKAQQIVHSFLYEQAYGYESRKTIEAIRDYLANKHYIIYRNKPSIQVEVLVPLKRAGLVGSVRDGYYYLSTLDDCNRSIDFHSSLIKAVQQVIDGAEEAKRRMSKDV